MHHEDSIVSVNGEPVLKISAHKKRVICDSIHEDMLEEDLNRRIRWVIDAKYNACLNRMVSRWLPILQSRYDTLPTNIDNLVNIIYEQPDYIPANSVPEVASNANVEIN